MTHVIHRACAGLLILAASATPSAAQSAAVPPSRSITPAVFPRWDVSGSMGMLNVSSSAIGGSPWRTWDQKFEYRADLGRYWTTHLRTELSVGTSNGWDETEVTPLPPGGVPGPAYGFTEVERRLTTVAPAATWQFRENAFMHPYVSAGVKLGILQQRRVWPSPGEPTTSLVARPFLAGGFKSYVSRSVFVRTEGRVAVGSTGAQQISILAGIGFDF